MITKKFKYVAALAVASLLGFTSCSNNEVSEVENSKPKTVFLKIEREKSNTANTRAEITPASEESVQFNSGELYFVANNNLIVKHYKITTASGGNAENSVSMDQLEAGKIFSNLPGTVSAVKIVGNTEVTQTTGNFINTETHRINIDKQADIKNVNLYGVGNLVPNPNKTVNDYTASVLLTPTVSRIEVSKIQSKGTVISNFKIEGVFIDNFYEKAYVNGNTSTLNPINGESEPENFMIDSKNGAYTSDFQGILFDWYSGGLAAVSSGTGLVAGPKEGKIWGYNVFSQLNNGTSPRVIIRIIDVEKTEGGKVDTYAGPYFLTVKLKQANSLLKEIDPGKIYSIGGVNGIIFDETNLTPEPNTDHIEVDVTVTLTEWTRIEPEYEL